MAKINIPYAEGNLTPTIPGGMTDTGMLESRTNQVQGAGDALLDQSFRQADAARSMAYSAELKASDAEQNASLMKLLPAAAKEIGTAMDMAVEKIARLDQAQFDENLQKEMNAYMLKEGYDFQEQFLHYKQSLKEANGGKGDADAPKKMSEWVNARMQGVIGKAPSEKAKLGMTEYLMKAKLNALEDGFQIRDRALAAARQQAAKDAVDAVIKMTRKQPENSFENIKLLQNIGNQLVYEGVPKAQVNPFLDTAAGQIYGASAQGFLEKGNGTGAALVLGSEQAKAKMDPTQHKSILNKVANAELMKYTTSVKEIKLGINMALAEQGDLAPGAPGADGASDVMFQRHLSAVENPANLQNPGQALQWSDTLLNDYFSKYNRVMGKETAQNLMDTATQRANPNAALAASLVLDAIVKDNSGRFGNLGRELLRHDTGNYSENLQAAHTMVRRVAAGETPVQAWETVQKILTPATPQEVEVRKKIINDYAKISQDKEKPNAFMDQAFKAIEYDPAWYKFSETPDVNSFNSDRYLGQYKTIFEDNYILTGSIEAATAATNAQIRTRWGVTSVNGRQEIMEGAPSVVYSNKTVAEKTLQEAAIKAAIEQGGFDANYNKGTKLLTKYDTYADDKTQTVQVKKDANGNPIPDVQRRVGIAPLYNYTMKTDAKVTVDEERTYMVVDLDTGIPLRNKDDSTQLVTVTYGKNIVAYEEKKRLKQVELVGDIDETPGRATTVTLDMLVKSGSLEKDSLAYRELEWQLRDAEGKQSK
jgi:hypothetical protein